MRVVKFKINEKYYDEFKEICVRDNVTIKGKLNVLLSQDVSPRNITDYYPEDANQNTRRLTLKINEELYKGIMKKCGKYDFAPSKYVPYLIYKYLCYDLKK